MPVFDQDVVTRLISELRRSLEQLRALSALADGGHCSLLIIHFQKKLARPHF
jgi:hypothetical protein